MTREQLNEQPDDQYLHAVQEFEVQQAERLHQLAVAARLNAQLRELPMMLKLQASA